MTTLSTGKMIEANRDIIGLSSGPELELFGGYDDSINSVMDVRDFEDERPKDELTMQECIELADIMIARWTAFKAKAQLRR